MQPGSMTLASPCSVETRSLADSLRSLVGRQQFEHWFGDKTQLVVEDDTLVVLAPSPFLMQWLQKKFRQQLAAAACAVLGLGARLRFEVAAEPLSPRGDSSTAPASVDMSHAPAEVLPSSSPATPRSVLKMAEAPTLDARELQPVARRTGRRFADLADLVAGSCNQLALTAVAQVCARPLESSGPLFIYGPVGVGKTHILEGTYRHIRRQIPQAHVLFLTSEQFTNYFTQAYRDHTLPAFRQRFRTVDALLIDDVDFVEGKRAVEEEFLHTVRQLESHGKLFVACGDRHPRLMTKISDELRTRLLAGMVCRLETPDLETRGKIVAQRAARLDAEFTPEALRYVAERFSGSVRELEGALHSLQVYSRMTGKRVGITVAREALADLERDCLRIVRLDDVERVVCGLFGLGGDELRSARRTRTLAEPRMLAMYLARRLTRAAYSEIGRHFGGRNHATVISAERKVASWLSAGAAVQIAARSWQVAEVVQTLEQQLLAG